MHLHTAPPRIDRRRGADQHVFSAAGSAGLNPVVCAAADVYPHETRHRLDEGHG